MPGDGAPDDTTKPTNNGGVFTGLADPDIAEARLQQEAKEMRRQPLSYGGRRGVRNVTADFVAVSEQLRPGQLVKDEYFTLFEAVGALECSNVIMPRRKDSKGLTRLALRNAMDDAMKRRIDEHNANTFSKIMDPKMDSGYVPPGDDFEPDFDVCAGLRPAQVLGIMDELFRLEMSFHDGYPLSQNIFTSLHIMRLIHPNNVYPHYFRFDGVSADDWDSTAEEQLVQIVLRAYCIAAIKMVELALNMIQDHTFYEEEDFVTYLFGRELCPKVTASEALKLLVDAMDWVDDSELDREMKFMLKHRLVMREDMLLAMCGGDEDDIRSLDKFLAAIVRVEEQHDNAKFMPEAFSDKVQRQLATSTPPRPMPELSWNDACKKWAQLCKDMKATFDLTSLPQRSSPQCLQRATWAFTYREPPPNTYARARMQYVLTADNHVANEVPLIELMFADIKDLVLAGSIYGDEASFAVEVPTHPLHKKCRLIEEFMHKWFGEYVNLYTMVCQNRCRMRRGFGKALTRFVEMETDARSYDAKVSPDSKDGMLTTWVQHHKTRLQEWTLLLGFETDLYAPREFCDVYSVVHEISTQRALILTRVDEAYILLITSSADSRGRVKNEKQGFERMGAIKWIEALLAQVEITIALSNVLCFLYNILERLHLIDTNPRPYEDRDLSFEARMKPLLQSGWSASSRYSRKDKPDVDVIAFCKNFSATGSQSKAGREHLAKLKGQSARDARYVGTETEWKKEMKALETAWVAVTVTISQLQRICEKHGKKIIRVGDAEGLQDHVEVVIPKVGKRYHDWWVVPQLKEKK